MEKKLSLILNAVLISFLLMVQTAISQEKSAGKKPANEYNVVGNSITGASEVKQVTGKIESKLTLESSDKRLVEAFNWAKRQAMAFVYDGDPVGPWYEAAEPGREAFCMRDVAHQAMGAHALGLARYNFNMLKRFAENISDSRDWCSYWEIDRYNRPAPVDYENDAEFWYNLPANFDILDCCYRMYVWPGDLTYINDPVFQNFYDRTVVDYVERWGLSLDQIMKRPRLLNARGIFDPNKKFQAARGIPGYDEQNHDYIVGIDVLATQYQAYMAYARIQEVRGKKETALKFFKKADDVKTLVHRTWWNEKEQNYFIRLNKDYTLEGSARSSLISRDIMDESRIQSLIKNGGSAETLYRFGNPDTATTQLLETALGSRSRKEYPEVPFSWIGDFVNGTMGVTLDAPSALLSAQEGFWVATVVKTLSGLGTKIAWAELRNLPIRSNEVTLRHDGQRKTTITNQKGPAFIWLATFAGPHKTLLVNGRSMNAQMKTDSLNRQTSSVRVTVGGGGTISVEVVD